MYREFSWHLLALWLVLSIGLFAPKKILSYAKERKDGKIVLKESLFGSATIIDRKDISTIEVYEVDNSPIGLKIFCENGQQITFAPLRVDISLLESVRDFILKKT